MRRPRGFWRDAIYEALRSFGGEAYLSPDIYDWVENNVTLTDRELSPSPYGDRPRYVHTVRGIASDMANQDLLIRVADGCYRLP